MSSPRFTIAALMFLVAHVALGFAALRNADELWASATFTAAVTATLIAAAGALVRRGPARLPWLSFALFAGVALLLWFQAAQFALLATPGVAGRGGRGYGSMMSGMMGAGFAPPAADPADPPLLLPLWAFRGLQPILGPQGSLSAADALAYAQVSHALQAIVFGWLGALLCRLAAGKDDRSETAPRRRERLVELERAVASRSLRSTAFGRGDPEVPDELGEGPARPGTIVVQDAEWDAIVAELERARESEARGFDLGEP